MKSQKTYFVLGGNKHPVFVSDDMFVFSKAWRWRIGTHKTSQVFLLKDFQFHQYFPNIEKDLFSSLPVNIIHSIYLQATEENKNWQTLTHILNELFQFTFDRQTILVCMGGGVVCDLGGFVASILKRGIKLVLIPTTLLSMTDAAIGGKNGVNFTSFKNQIGSFHIPDFVFIYRPFLETLPTEHLLSGYAEMLKHALIADINLFKNLNRAFSPEIPSLPWIAQSIRIKLRIVKEDPHEKNKRRLLNFGHTIGHALESYYMEKQQPILHGNAIALGMIEEIFFSSQLLPDHSKKIFLATDFIHKHYPHYPIPSWEKLVNYILHDKKKNTHHLDIVLLKNIGTAVIKKISIDELKSLHEKFLTS
ncbi:MAG: 3-dehydroquinate synthase [Bacteroidales bacterium]|nr:3-dehydroquinate synthase [Bacteroidales bacterium]